MSEKTLVKQLLHQAVIKSEGIWSCHRYCSCCPHSDLCKLADRIEAEMNGMRMEVKTAAETAANQYAIRKRLEDRLNASIELPKDADGVPCFVGDYVDCFAILANGEHTESRCQGKIQSMILCGDNSWLLMVENGEETENGDPVKTPWPPRNVVHVEPPKQLTKEDIDAMAKMETNEFWGCDWECNYGKICPSKIEGEEPYKHYRVDSCTCIDAKPIHLIYLERERVAGEQS